MRPDERVRLGALGEGLAYGYLTARGYEVVARNWRAPGGGGELDLVCRDGPTLVFVEVRTRRARRDGTMAFGTPLDSLDLRKRRQVIALARRFMAGRPARACRFDVVCVTLEGTRPQLRHLRDAFP